MAELKFVITVDNKDMMRAMQDTQSAMQRTARNVEQIGELLNLEEFREASTSITDFATKFYDASQETVSSLSDMSREFSTQADAIRSEMEGMMGSDAMDGMADKLTAYKQAVMDASASAETAYNVQGAAVAALAEELDTLQQAQEAAFSAGDSGSAKALQGDIDALSSTLEQANTRLGELGQQAETASTALNGLDSAVEQFGSGAQSLTSLWGQVKDSIGEATEATKNWLTGNGKFTEGLNAAKSALAGMGGAFVPAIAGAKKMLVALRAMIATPIGAVLTAVVVALQAMHKWFTKSANGQIAFAKVSAAVGSILNSIIDVAIKVGEYLFKAFSDPNKPLGQFARSVGSTFVNAIKAAYDVVKGFAQSIGALVDIIKGAANFDGDAILSAWSKFKDAGNTIIQGFGEAGQAFKSAIESQVNLVRSVVSVARDVYDGFSFDKLEKGVSTMLSASRESAELAGRQKEQEIALSEATARQAELEKQIGERYEKLYKLKGKERQDAINELKELQKAKYDDVIKAQTELYKITKRNNELHSSTLEDLQHERDLRVQMLQSEAQRANATRMLARLEASNERQMERSAAKSTKSGKGNGASSADAKKAADAQAAIAELERKQTAERVTQQVALEEQLIAARIAAMKDGAEKVAAEREAENKRELVQLAEQRKAALEAEYQRQKAEYEAQQKLIAAQGGQTKPWEASMLDQSAMQQISDQYEELAKLIQQKQKNVVEKEEASAMRAYLRSYGTYQERRLAIAEDYEQQIAEAMTEGDKKALVRQREAALAQLDKDFGLRTQEMADLFADASDKSIKSIDAIIRKYKALVNFMQGTGNISRDDLLSIGFSDEDIRKLQTGEIKIKDITDAIEKLETEINKRSPFKTFADDLDKALEKFDKGEIGEGIQGIGNAVNKFLPKVKQFGAEIANIFGFDDTKLQGVIEGVGGLAEAAAGAGQIMSGDIVGGLMSAATGISKIVSAVDSLFGADYSSYEKLVEQYNKLIDVWDELLEKKREYLDTSYGAEAIRAEKEATDILNKEAQAWRELGKERLNAGGGLFSHTIGVRMLKNMKSSDWGDISKALGSDARKILGDRLTGLFDLSSDQLSRLKEQAPAFWAKMDDDVRKYLQSIIDGAEQLEDVQLQAKERLTQTTFDAVRDDFLSKLSDMETAASDFSDDFSQMLFQAMLKTKFDELFDDRLNDWYDQFATAMKDSEISDSERNALLSDWDSIVADSIKLRDNLADVTGYAKSATEGSGSFKAVSSFTQEQGDELNGRLTSIQIGQQVANESLAQAVIHLQTLSITGSANTGTLNEMRNLLLIGNGHLEDIARYTKIASQYGDAIETIANKIKEL